MFRIHTAALAVAVAAVPIATITAKPVQNMAFAGQTPPYAGIVDRVLASPLLIDAVVVEAVRLKGADLAGLAPGAARFYIEADAGALIRGASGLSSRISYIADVPIDARGKPPKLKKTRVLLFARAVPGQAGSVRLTAPDAQFTWSPALDALVREIARDVVAPDAPPEITGVGNAFHVAGTIPGEGETQIFLTTADNRPVSLSVLRRPGEQPRWAVALSEIVDDSARPPERDTFLWYRLACALPQELPARAVDQLSGDDAARARDDYRFVMASLGACTR